MGRNVIRPMEQPTVKTSEIARIAIIAVLAMLAVRVAAKKIPALKPLAG